ncbi:MAG: ATP-dependent helicase UvrD/PcrA [Actinomycetota bacterium]|nr:ATP-dependent helicase UvrD/PcrA [Actinomycetota bacterium]
MSGDELVLTDEQRRAVEHPLDRALLIVAGAGTGKTTVMTERIAHLIATGQAQPNHILALTFTNKAAAELKRRVQKRLVADVDVTVGTYHSFAAGLVAGHALELDLDPRVKLLSRAQAWQLLYTVFDEFRFENRSPMKPGVVVEAALGLASRSANYLVEMADVAADCDELKGASNPNVAAGQWSKVNGTAVARRELCEVARAYGDRKRERNLIDFDDQIRLAVKLLRQNPAVATSLHEQHPVVLLDEYQDTNFAQREMLRAIYPPGSAVTAVGDDMQSIYAFRGAHIENILEFTSDFAPADEIRLTENRRSGSQVVELANRIQAEVDPKRTIPRTMRALDDAPPTTIECFLAADDHEEARTIADEVAAAGEPWPERAVLCRKRRLIPGIVAALEARGVPVEVVGTSGLLDRPEIIDLTSWLEVLVDPAASVGLLRILQGPRYRIGLRDLAALARRARALADDDPHRSQLGDALDDLGVVADLSLEGRARLNAFVDERREMAAAARRLSVLELCEHIVDRTGLWEAAVGRGRENLLRFLDMAQAFAPVEGDEVNLLAFLEHLQLIDESQEDVPESHTGGAEAVLVMTVHQAKGLEFDRVWVPGLGKNLFPDNRKENALTQPAILPWWIRGDTAFPAPTDITSWKEVEGELGRRYLDDERRLFYVACTRARHQLTLSAAQWYPGAKSPQTEGPFYTFVSQMPDLVDERFHHDPAAVDPDEAAKRRRAEALEVGRAAAPPPDGRPGTFGRPQQLGLLEDAGPTAPARPDRVPVALSVSNLVTFARCPRQMYWSVVRPLPVVTSGAASIGTEVHHWIELGGPPVIREPEPEQAADGGEGEGDDHGRGRTGRADIIAGLQSAFKASPFVDLTPVQVEAPFALAVGGHLIRGRIDAVYRRDGHLELVDFKTGREPAPGDRSAHTQLDLYALAAVDTWGTPAPELRTTYCYLRPDGSVLIDSTDWDEQRLVSVRADLDGWLKALDAGEHGAVVGDWCRRCDFVDACRPGQAHLSASAVTRDASQ